MSALNQARQPFFYEKWGVPDTLEGRFDIACLHIAVLLRHTPIQLGQVIFDTFFAYTEMTLREIGVSDLKVGREVKKCAKFFYGSLKAYNEGLESKACLKEAIKRNIYGNETCLMLEQFADYVTHCDKALQHLNVNQELDFMWPEFKKVEG